MQFIPFDELKPGDTVPIVVDEVPIWGTYLEGPDGDDDILFALHSDKVGWELEDDYEFYERAGGLTQAKWMERQEYYDNCKYLVNNPSIIQEPRRELKF